MRTILLWAIALLGSALPAGAEIKTIPVVCLTAEIEITAPSAAGLEAIDRREEPRHLVSGVEEWKERHRAADESRRYASRRVG